MAKKRKKITTVEGLAQFMQSEFIGVNKRFDAVDVRFDAVDVRFNKVETDIAILKSDVKEIRNDIDEIKRHSSELFAKLDEFISLYRDTKQELIVLARQVKQLEERITELESKK